VRANLPAEQQDDFDTFMDEYLDFNGVFAKSEDELVGMNLAFGEYYGQAIRETLPVQGRPGGWMVWAQYISMGRRHDYRAALAPVDVPVLVVHGADDLQSEAASRLYAETFPNAEFAVIDHAGHFSFDEQPEMFAETVRQFLSALK
jgi:proline iminopeptidase